MEDFDRLKAQKDKILRRERRASVSVKSYDQKSWDCAEHFMQDHPQGMAPEEVKTFTHDLARHIQQAVEDWFEDQGRSGWADLESKR
jgi:hypothetical protein